jgi:hypothetical protein
VKKREYRVVDRFIAVSEEGKLFTIMFIQEFILIPGDEGVERIEGIKIYRTGDGKHCRVIDDDTFEIIELGLIVVKV